MHKTFNGKQFDLGALYVVPWRVTQWKIFDQQGVSIPDGSIVVLLDIEEGSIDNKIVDYKIRLLTLEGEMAEIHSTVAGLDYWKTIEQINKNKKF